MDLNIEISPSEKRILEIIGPENWNQLKNNTLEKNKYVCCGCDFFPLNNNHKLNLHILPYDESIDLKSDFNKLNSIFLCDACHAIKHFDVSIANNWIKLVNSSFNQKDLIKLCRKSNKALNAYILGGHGVDKSIFLLKKKPEDYLNEIFESSLNINPKIKIIFTKNFNWSNSR